MVSISTVLIIIFAQLIAQLLFEIIKLFMVQKMALKFQTEKIDSLFTQLRKIFYNAIKEKRAGSDEV